MINQLAGNFLNSHSEFDAINLLRYIRCTGFNNLGMKLGDFFEKQFPYSVNIKDEYALFAYYTNDYTKSYDILERLLKMKGIIEQISIRTLFNQHFCIDHVCNRYINYNQEKISEIINRKPISFPIITFTITTCKRFDLFEQTINSFINCCEDLNKIDYWLCVDDNSSEEDRDKMKKLYPFFEFYFKDLSEKGHPQSMNIIRKKVTTPYIFHMEDDWKFFSRRSFLSDGMDVMGSNSNIKQCLINKNYSEIESDIDIKGGEYHITNNGVRFYIHEFTSNPVTQKLWHEKHGTNSKNCSYWPHFSFRPSLIRKSVLEELGEFNENISHFEMDYSSRYINKGYISAFFEGIYCIHIGRLTSERNDKTKQNAYDLNGEAQFHGKEKQIGKTFILNLDRRQDRWDKFVSNASNISLRYDRYSAVDGSKLISTSQLQRIFDGNDYNTRSGIVGCGMSHIKMCIELINSDYDIFCILEDDVEFVPDFDMKLSHIYSQIKDISWDILYLGHHLYEKYVTEDSYNKIKLPTIEKWDATTSLTKSMGGTGGYLISKQGANNLLEFINKNGMTNGIDTVQQKSANALNIYYIEPHLIYSECWRGNNNIDTDIQYNYNSLSCPVADRLNDEILFYGSLNVLPNFEKTLFFITNKEEKENSYYQDDNFENINNLIEKSVHPNYTLENSILIIIPKGNPNRYFDRLKKNNIWNIDDAIKYSS